MSLYSSFVKKRRKKKTDGFWLFLKAFSWDTDLLATQGDFTVKNANLGREICTQLKTDLVETKCDVQWLQSYGSHICKMIFRFEL